MSTDKLSRTELEAYFALITAGDLMQRAVTSQLAEHGLTPLQFSILATLLDAGDGLRMSDLANALVVSRSGLTYQITQLEKIGLVARSSSSGDSRGVVARLTETGAARVDETFPGHVALVRARFLDLLDADEVAALGATLEKVVRRLRDPGA
jgi:DNA-binding MarR family transcriptional regulator